MNEIVRKYLEYFAFPGWDPVVLKAAAPKGHTCPNYPPPLMRRIERCLRLQPRPPGAEAGPYDAQAFAFCHTTASRAVAQGVKVFCPTPDEAEALAACDADLTADDYRQPFPTMLYVVPESMRSGAAGGGAGLWNLVAVDVLAPGRVVVTGVVCRPGGSQIYFAYPGEGQSVRDNLAGSLDAKTAEVVRMAVNAGLYLSLRAVVLRQADPGRVKALRRLKRDRPQDWRDAQRRLKWEPVLVEPVRRIVARVQAPPAGPAGGPAGGRQRPHQRRGHFRMQRFGPGRVGRRLVFVEPYAVGGHADFGGTYVEYVTAV